MLQIFHITMRFLAWVKKTEIDIFYFRIWISFQIFTHLHFFLFYILGEFNSRLVRSWIMLMVRIKVNIYIAHVQKISFLPMCSWVPFNKYRPKFSDEFIVVLIFKLRPWTFNVKNLRHTFHDVFMSQEFGFRFGKCTIVNCPCAWHRLSSLINLQRHLVSWCKL